MKRRATSAQDTPNEPDGLVGLFAGVGSTGPACAERLSDRDIAIAMDAEELAARLVGTWVEPTGEAAKTVH